MQENVNSANYNSSIIHMYKIASFTQRQGIFLSLPLGTSFHGYTRKLPRETVFLAFHVLLRGLSQGKNDYTQKFGAQTAYSFIFSVCAHNFSI